MQVTQEALFHGIEQAEAGNRLSDIGAAIEAHVRSHGMSVVRDFVGHGVGRNMHEAPQVQHHGPAGRGPVLRPGMCLAIEPQVNLGSAAVRMLEDGWTAVTVDGSLSCHFEHTVAITADGPEILTLRTTTDGADSARLERRLEFAHGNFGADGDRRRVPQAIRSIGGALSTRSREAIAGGITHDSRNFAPFPIYIERADGQPQVGRRRQRADRPLDGPWRADAGPQPSASDRRRRRAGPQGHPLRRLPRARSGLGRADRDG